MTKLQLGGIIRSGSGQYCFKIKGNMETLQEIKDQLTKQFNNEGYDLTKQRAYFDRKDYEVDDYINNLGGREK